MTDREFWELIWRATVMGVKALQMIESAIAKKYGFGKFRPAPTDRMKEIAKM